MVIAITAASAKIAISSPTCYLLFDVTLLIYNAKVTGWLGGGGIIFEKVVIRKRRLVQGL